MKRKGKKLLCASAVLLVLFVVWTILVQTVDVRSVGESNTPVGFAALNCRFHQLVGVHLKLYILTDWLGLVPVCVCLIFGVAGLIQLIKRKSLKAVDFDILALGIYYLLVVMGYLIFEACPINYRPILIRGVAEPSYPSSTTLLVLSVMPTLAFQAKCRLKKGRSSITVLSMAFSLFMVIGRAVSGVHWITDIMGAVILSLGLCCGYQGIVLRYGRRE